jgi:hypothetical protein
MSSHETGVNCDRCVDAAPYVLGALAEPEPYGDHLATCAICQAEVAKLQPVVDTLARTVPPAAATARLRQRVLATVRSEAELLQAAGHEADEPPKPRRWRSSRWAIVSTSIAIAASVAVAAIALNVGSSTRERVRVGQVAASIQGAHASLHEFGDRAELVLSGMPQPRLGRIYEVWLNRRTGSPQPTDALFGVTSEGDGSVNVPNSLHGVKEVLVTSEPLGGSSHPSGSPVIRVIVGA